MLSIGRNYSFRLATLWGEGGHLIWRCLLHYCLTDFQLSVCVQSVLSLPILGWMYILEQHGGRLPLKIKAVPEGTIVPYKNGESRTAVQCHVQQCTVKPLNSRHIGGRTFVCCREVVPISEVDWLPTPPI